MLLIQQGWLPPRVENAVTFNNQNGCSQVPSDQQFTMDVMAGYAANPNVYGLWSSLWEPSENCGRTWSWTRCRTHQQAIGAFHHPEATLPLPPLRKAVRGQARWLAGCVLSYQEAFGMSEQLSGRNRITAVQITRPPMCAYRQNLTDFIMAMAEIRGTVRVETASNSSA